MDTPLSAADISETYFNEDQILAKFKCKYSYNLSLFYCIQNSEENGYEKSQCPSIDRLSSHYFPKYFPVPT